MHAYIYSSRYKFNNIYICLICIYIYIYMFNMYIYIFMYIYICIYMYISLYIYINYVYTYIDYIYTYYMLSRARRWWKWWSPLWPVWVFERVQPTRSPGWGWGWGQEKWSFPKDGGTPKWMVYSGKSNFNGWLNPFQWWKIPFHWWTIPFHWWILPFHIPIMAQLKVHPENWGVQPEKMVIWSDAKTFRRNDHQRVDQKIDEDCDVRM